MRSKGETTMETAIKMVELTEQVYTVPQVAKILKCNPNYARELIKSGALKAIRLGEVKVPAAEITAFLDRSLGQDLNNPYNIKALTFETK